MTENDAYDGYHIPKGALVHGNQWAVHREEKVYPEPEEFDPDRWLNEKSQVYKAPLETYPNIRRYSAFGFGRRICPGFETAERSLFIQVASLAWACQISKRVGLNGKEIEVPWYDPTEGSNVGPKPFVFDLRPRSEKRLSLMQQTRRETCSF